MYQPTTPGYRKTDPAMRWALPDRVFFACGACHILAYAFLSRWPYPDLQPIWIKPQPGHTGNHIFIDGGAWTIDYHGYAAKPAYLDHIWRRARHMWPGWDATLIPLPPDILISKSKSRTYDGLWLREPTQFLHDAMPCHAMPRARAYLDRFPPPPAAMSPAIRDCSPPIAVC